MFQKRLSTTISNSYGVKISTIEHLMSALSGLHIDNLNIYINAMSANYGWKLKTFCEMIEEIGIKNKVRKEIVKCKKIN